MFMSKAQKLLDDDARFDRLVDGALSPAEYKAFVAALDDEPSGWRRCGLAFLEAQAWGKEFTAIRKAEQDGPKPATNPVELKTARRGWNLLSASSLLGVAVSLVLAFGLGLLAHNRLFPARAVNQQVVAAPSQPGAAQGAAPTNSGAAASEIDQVHLVIDRGAGLAPQEIVVPVDVDKPGAQPFAQLEPAISDRVLRSLQSRGHRINRQQEYIPIDLEDGRQIIVPVDGYQITPVGRRY